MPVTDQASREIRHRSFARKPEPELPVLTKPEVRIEANPRSVSMQPPEQNAGMHEGIPERQRPPDSRITQRRMDHPGRAARLADNPPVHAKKNQGRIFSHGTPLRGKPLRMGKIICILPRHPVRTTFSKSLVQAGGLTGILAIAKQPDPRIAGRIGL